MNRYKKGFLTKCAEYGIDGRKLLEKRALDTANLSKALSGVNPYLYSVLGGSLLGGFTGGVFSKKKNRLRNAILGALLGGAAGGGMHYGLGKLWDKKNSQIRSEVDNYREQQEKALQTKYKNQKQQFRQSLNEELRQKLNDGLAPQDAEISKLNAEIKSLDENSVGLKKQLSILQNPNGVSLEDRIAAANEIQRLLGKGYYAQVLEDTLNDLESEMPKIRREALRIIPKERIREYTDKLVALRQKATNRNKAIREARMDAQDKFNRIENRRKALEDTKQSIAGKIQDIRDYFALRAEAAKAYKDHLSGLIKDRNELESERRNAYDAELKRLSSGGEKPNGVKVSPPINLGGLLDLD